MAYALKSLVLSSKYLLLSYSIFKRLHDKYTGGITNQRVTFMQNHHSNIELNCILNLRQLLDALGKMSKASAYNRMNPNSDSYDKNFPLPFKMTSRKDGKSAVNGWLSSEVQAYIDLLASTRNRAG